MIIAAFDLSLTATGWARSEGGFGLIVPPKGMTGIERLRWIRDSVLRIAIGAGSQEPADVVVLEGLAFGAKGNAMLDLAGLGAVVRVGLSENALLAAARVDIPPACLKLFATGKGNAKKDDVFAAAIRKLDYAGNDHNEADALWLLEMAKRHYTEHSYTLNEGRALKKIVWPELAVA